MLAKLNKPNLLIVVVSIPVLILVALLALAANQMQGVSRIASAATLQPAASDNRGSPEGQEGSEQSALDATLIGHVIWQGWPPSMVQPDPLQRLPFTITLTPLDPSGGIMVNFPFMYTDEYGFFTITTDLLQDGDYMFRFKGHPPDPVNDPGPSWMATVGSTSIADGQTTRVELGLQRGGDADNSSPSLGIDVIDFNILKYTFGKMQGVPGFDARANFVQESASTPEVIDVHDFALLKLNFGILQP